jgi:anti-anti-sigma regulatory factor
LARDTTLILILRDVDDLGGMEIQLFQRYATDIRQAGGALVLAGVSENLNKQLRCSGLFASHRRQQRLQGDAGP